MEQCANTLALNKYLSGEEQFEKVADRFSVEVLGELDNLRSFAKDFEGYDLADVLKDIIKEEFNLKDR